MIIGITRGIFYINKKNVDNRLILCIFSVSDTGILGQKKILTSQVKRMTFWLLVQMPYHRAKGDLWELNH